jgi:ABC-type maltose transport system permease subunit
MVARFSPRESVPVAFEHAALLDGANDVTSLWRIVPSFVLSAVAVVISRHAVPHGNS